MSVQVKGMGEEEEEEEEEDVAAVTEGYGLSSSLFCHMMASKMGRRAVPKMSFMGMPHLVANRHARPNKHMDCRKKATDVQQ